MDTLRGIEVPLVTSWPVLTEAFYLLGFSWRAQDNLWEFIIRGGVEIVSLDEEMMIRCRYLMKKYADLPMDLADGAMVVIGEKKKAGTFNLQNSTIVSTSVYCRTWYFLRNNYTLHGTGI